MPSLVIHAPEYQLVSNDKKSFKDTFETGIGKGYALNSKILDQVLSNGILRSGLRVVLLCKDRKCRAEGKLVRIEPATKNGKPWITRNGIQRYNVYAEHFVRVPYKPEKLNRNGVAVIDT